MKGLDDGLPEMFESDQMAVCVIAPAFLIADPHFFRMGRNFCDKGQSIL